MSRTRLGRLPLVLGLALTCALVALVAFVWIGHDQASEALTLVEVHPGPEGLAFDTLAGSTEEAPTEATAAASRSGKGSSAPLRAESGARVRAGSRDARSGAAIPGLRLEFVEDVTAPETARISYASADRKGIVERNSFLVGRWRITASSMRHRPLVLGTFSTSVERPLDLGLITLEPLPVLHGRLLDATGKPAGGNTITEVEKRERPKSERLVTATDTDGTFELVGDLEREFVLQVNPLGVQGGFCGQRFALQLPPEDEEIVLQLAVYQHLILSVYGVGRQDSRLLISLCPEVDEPTEYVEGPFGGHGHHEPLVRPRELPPSADSLRFECYVAAGRYRVWGGVPSIRLELPEGLPECELTIRGH